ncbi:MAG: hypothetical protein HYY01_11200 [Chloroflexi bacterium]|nr:hypothetical protein [Chloroflexota bacterium]
MYSALPLLDGWSRHFYTKFFTQTIPRGASLALLEERQPGWWIALGGLVDRNDAVIVVEMDGRLALQASVSDLNTASWTLWSAGFPYLEQYDVANSLYTIGFAPAAPMPFRTLKVSLNNPATSDLRLLSVIGMAAVIENPDALRASYSTLLRADQGAS